MKILSREEADRIYHWQEMLDESEIDFHWKGSRLEHLWYHSSTENMDSYTFYLSYVVPVGTKLGRLLVNG